MQETKGLLDQIKQHDKLAIRVSSNSNNYLPVNVMLVGLSLKYPTAKKNLIVENALGPKEL